jgi:C4-dicarboxylate-specific signal transduction histidine kinase
MRFFQSATHAAPPAITPAQRDAEAALARLLEAERTRAERVQNILRLIILIALGAGAIMYAPSLPLPLRRANVAVLLPMLAWSVALVIVGQHRKEQYPRWLSLVGPIVDVSAVTAIILCYGLIGTPAVALKAPIVLSYFAILAARPMAGSVRSAAATAMAIVAEYGAAVVCLTVWTELSLTLDPLIAAESASVSVLDEVMKVILLAASGFVAVSATAWHERVLRRALTAQVTRDAEARELTQHLQEADKLAALGTLAASIAHDVTNPLTAIALQADMLARSAADAETRTSAAEIAADARNTALVVRNLLGFARNDTAVCEPVAIHEVVEHAVGMLHQMLRTQGVYVDYRQTPDLPYIEASSAALERVLVNLVINAAQAMEGQPEPHVVRITTAYDVHRVELSIEDNGPGFPIEVAARLFDRFFTTKPAGKGTGLGLWMAAQVVEAYGGTIAALNTGHGARFTITFPRERAIAAA